MLQLVKNINEKTGEIISEKQKYFEDTLTEEGYKVPSHKLGAKIFSDVSFPIEMTDSEIGKMARLSKLMIATSNMLGYRSKAGIRPYTAGKLINILNLSYKRGKAFLEKMVRLGVMQINRRKYYNIEMQEYYINPAYFFAGRRIDLNLYLLFREHLDQILPEWVRLEFWKAAKEEKQG